MADEIEPNVFGWDLLYSLYERQITTKMNVIVVWTHFNLLRRGFKSAGMGEDPTLPSQKDLKETLPLGWTEPPCRMRYFLNKKLYLLTIQTPDEDGDVIINLSRPCDNRAEVTTMSVDEVIQLTGHLEEIMPDWRMYLQRMTEDMIEPLLNNEASKDIQVQTDPVTRDQEPTRRFYHSPADIPLPTPPRISFMVPPVGIGSADLNPLGGGGGMLFQPPGMGPRPFIDPLLPRGAVPPGARFDPILPGRGRMPSPDSPMPDGPRPHIYPRGNYPDHDHLPPPGYDDMFS